jgi:phosphoribosylamine-glycine ligase
MGNSILVLNGSHSEIPLIKGAKRLGFLVYTAGNNPDLVGHAYGDGHFNVDYADAAAVVRLAKRLGVDYVLSGSNDLAMLTASMVAENLGLPGHDSYSTTRLIHLKDNFKKIAASVGIPTPKGIVAGNWKEAVSAVSYFESEVIVKPTDSAGGKGVGIINSADDCDAVFETAFKHSRCKKIIVEQFFQGQLCSFSTFIRRGKVVAFFGDREFSTVNRFTVSLSLGCADYHKNVDEILIGAAERLSVFLNLVDGVLHFQYIDSHSGPQVLEVTRRCSGDLYSEPVSLSLGCDWAEWIVLAAAGLFGDVKDTASQNGFVGRFAFMANRNGKLNSFSVDESLRKYIKDEVFAFKPGHEINNFLGEKLGVIIFEFPNRVLMEQVGQRVPELAGVALA